MRQFLSNLFIYGASIYFIYKTRDGFRSGVDNTMPPWTQPNCINNVLFGLPLSHFLHILPKPSREMLAILPQPSNPPAQQSAFIFVPPSVSCLRLPSCDMSFHLAIPDQISWPLIEAILPFEAQILHLHSFDVVPSIAWMLSVHTT